MKINTPTVRSRDLNIITTKSDLNLDICLQLSADSYISGPSGVDYLDLDSFKNNNIELLIQQYTPPVYNSKFFQLGLSTLDLLFNEGENARDIIINSGNIEVKR
jgi:hypothetical protein